MIQFMTGTKQNLKKILLLGRALTRSGDQAWDFAVPLAILKLVPGELQYAALYYFLIRLANVLFFPKTAKLIDRVSRFSAAKLGISIQLAGVLAGFLSLFYLSTIDLLHSSLSLKSYFVLGLLILGGILGFLGSSFMDIAIANDLVPASIEDDQLAPFNARLRQVDLFTELCAPIIAGWLLTFETSRSILFGFGLIALWNLISFFPEYFLLKLIFNKNPELSQKKVSPSKDVKKSLFDKLTKGWRTFLSQPIAIVSLAYACLWLSVLSPHGVLLTGFLKDGWSLPEWGIGLFRGLGGFFGLAATLLFPIINKKLGLEKSSRFFLGFQLITVSLALFFFFQSDFIFKVLFLGLILFSRIGLYGFSLGEVQIRQVYIKEEVRGEFNGFASALTAITTLGLYGGGALLPETEDFSYLIVISVLMVIVGFVLFNIWLNKKEKY